MKNLENSLHKRSKIIKYIALIFLFVSFIGLVDTAYLTMKHYSGDAVVCSIVTGCDEVLTSKYATVTAANIPTAMVGAGYYLAVFLLAVAYLDRKKELFLKFIAYLTTAGFIASLGFLYIQIFVLGALCFYCLVSLGTSTLLFIAGMYVLRIISFEVFEN